MRGDLRRAVAAFLGVVRDNLYLPWLFWFDADHTPPEGAPQGVLTLTS